MKAFFFALVLELIFPVVCLASDMPDLMAVPRSIDKSHKHDLQLEHDRLSALSDSLDRRVTDHNARCKGIAEGSPEEARCKLELQQLQVDADQLGHDIKTYNKTVFDSLTERIKQLKAQIALDENSINRFGFNQKQSDLESWVSLSAQAKEEFEKESRTALKQSIKHVIDAACADAVTRASQQVVNVLDNRKAEIIVSSFQRLGVDDPALFKRIRDAADPALKPSSARYLDAVMQRLSQLSNSTETLTEPIRDGGQALEALNAIFDVTIPEPRLQLLAKLTAEDFRFAFYSANNTYTRLEANMQIERINQLTEQQLQTLGPIVELLKRHVLELKNAKAELSHVRQDAGE